MGNSQSDAAPPQTPRESRSERKARREAELALLPRNDESTVWGMGGWSSSFAGFSRALLPGQARRPAPPLDPFRGLARNVPVGTPGPGSGATGTGATGGGSPSIFEMVKDAFSKPAKPKENSSPKD